MELRELAELGVAIGAEEAERLGSMTDMILEWNKVINVTAIRDRQEFIDKNVIDSLLLAILPEF
ncbi:MAG: class I SAM-dependent methyltransferase, partial [Firmicutes bacterium]|nr:class I SAM-dependent methyltransferase [Bacillota bacterium]